MKHGAEGRKWKEASRLRSLLGDLQFVFPHPTIDGLADGLRLVFLNKMYTVTEVGEFKVFHVLLRPTNLAFSHNGAG